MMKNKLNRLRYCLYARKSSENDDRQTASLDSQLSVMTQKAMKLGIEIVHIVQEAHSAKESGTRKGLEEVVEGITANKWNAILTWAPDRLSRNAGDIGRIVDLMDLGRLKEIQTNEQKFTNHPDDKFLLMILTSQAKLENDYRGKNVMRGMRAVCHTGKRPGPPPIGYKLWRDPENISTSSKIIIDEERAQYIQRLFHLVAENHFSCREAHKRITQEGFITTKGNFVSLVTILKILKDPFYYGEFEYPKGSGSWYKGSHTPLISQEVFVKTQKSFQQTKKDIQKPLLAYIAKKVRCRKCSNHWAYSMGFKASRLSMKCSNTTCQSKKISLKKWYKMVAAELEQQSLPKKSQIRIQRLQTIVSDFTGKSVSDLNIIEYLLEKGSRNDLYYLLKETKVSF